MRFVDGNEYEVVKENASGVGTWWRVRGDQLVCTRGNGSWHIGDVVPAQAQREDSLDWKPVDSFAEWVTVVRQESGVDPR